VLDEDNNISTWGVKDILLGHCSCCRRKVKRDENFLNVHLGERSAFFHWECFIALMKNQGLPAAEGRYMEGAQG
jgi:hypothetical protein